MAPKKKYKRPPVVLAKSGRSSTITDIFLSVSACDKIQFGSQIQIDNSIFVIGSCLLSQLVGVCACVLVPRMRWLLYGRNKFKVVIIG